MFFFCSSRRRHTRWPRDWSSDVCSSDLLGCGADDLAAVTQLFESGHGCLDAPDNTVEVDGKQFLDAFLCDVLEWRCGRNAGGVHDDVEAAQFGCRLFHCCEHAVPIGDVYLDGLGATRLVAKLFSHPGCRFKVQIRDCNLEAICVKPFGNSLSNALPTAGDQRNLAILFV